jgi:hypothetical protein
LGLFLSGRRSNHVDLRSKASRRRRRTISRLQHSSTAAVLPCLVVHCPSGSHHGQVRKFCYITNHKTLDCMTVARRFNEGVYRPILYIYILTATPRIACLFKLSLRYSLYDVTVCKIKANICTQVYKRQISCCKVAWVDSRWPSGVRRSRHTHPAYDAYTRSKVPTAVFWLFISIPGQA